MHDKLVVITGAAAGIGRATTLAFAKRGARLAVCDIDQAKLDDLARELGDRCVLARRVDVASPEQMSAFADAVHAIEPAADVVVNNAGVAFCGGLLETKLEDWDWLLGINLRGVIHGCHFFAPKMVARGSGHIVNLSSVLGVYGLPGLLAYCTSKFAVHGLSQSLRAELAPHGVGVTAMCPGMIATSIVDSARWGGETGRGQTRASALFRKSGTSPESVATAIVRAVERNPRVMPVAPSGWLVYTLSRTAPGVLDKLSMKMFEQLGSSFAHR